MARLDPAEGFEVLKGRVKEAIAESFPHEGSKNVLELESIDIPDKLSVSDVTDQKSAKMNDRTWGVPVHATLILKDKKTDKILDRSKIKIATLPKITNRYSYIVDGSEYQVDNQWRLKPGVYTKVQQNGELDSFFNIKGQPLHIGFDPKERSFVFKHGGAQPPLYPIMRALGHSDSDLEKAWGKDILNANMVDSRGKVLNIDKHAINFANRMDPEAEVDSFEKASEVIKQKLEESKLHPDVTSRTLGKPIDRITPDAVLRSSQRLLGIARGTEKPDVRDSLMYKEFLSTEDFIGERIRQTAPVIKRRIGNNIDRRDRIRDIVGMDVFQRPIKEFFSKVSLASTPEQTNPLKMISGQLRTTIAGEGGVMDANRITEDAKLVDPSHFGVLDPLHTPECLHPTTSVYTKRGWVLAPDLKDDDLFACNIDGKLEFHKADKITREPYRGLLYGMNHHFMSYLVTPDHRMWCRPLDKRTPNAGKWRFETAEQIHGKTRNFISTHDPYEGDSCSLYEMPLPFEFDSEITVSTSMWCALIGWYLSEGSLTVSNMTDTIYSVHIHQSDSANPDNCKEIAWVLDRLPFEYRYSGKSFVINDRRLAEYLASMGRYQEDRFIPEYLFELGVEAREELLGALLMGDGRLNYRRQNGDLFHDRDTYTTTSSRLAADVERLIISLGYASTTHVYEDKREERYLDVYEIRIQRRSERVVRGLRDQYTIDYDGMIYCATVPGSMLYVRKDGKCPFWTGNSVKTGVNLQLSLGARKVGTRIEIPLISVKTGKVVYLDPGKINDSIVALPDSVKRVGDKFVPKDGTTVLVSAVGNELKHVPIKDVEYIVPRSSQIFSIATNMVPFISSDSPNRATMAGRHMEQAIPLRDPEPPLVQSVLGKKSFDELVGSYASHSSPVTGKITQVGKDAIHVLGEDNKSHAVSIYNYYPTNDKKGMIHSNSLVKAGDKVTKGQVIADTNFSVSGDEEVLVREFDVVRRVKLCDLVFSENQEVLALSGADLRYEWKHLEELFKHKTSDPLMRITTRCGRSFKVTASHSCLTVNDKGDIVEVRPVDMTAGKTVIPVMGSVPVGGDCWDIAPYGPKSRHQKNATREIHSELRLDRELGFLLGMYLSEGDIPHTKYVRIAVTNDTLRKVVISAADHCGFPVTEQINTVTIGCAQLSRAVKAEFGHLAAGKVVPGWVFAAPRDFVEGMIDGIWSGDGTLYLENESVCSSFQSDSEDLTRSTQSLLSELGVISSFSEFVWRAPGFVDPNERHFRLWVAGASIGMLPQLSHPEKERLRQSWMPPAHDKIAVAPLPRDLCKVKALNVKMWKGFGGLTFVRRNASGRLCDLINGEVLWDLVEHIEEIDPEPLVYDLVVRDHATFVLLSGITVHNTKNGIYSPGKNLEVAYMPWRGYNFEDGVVISESASQKLTSEHLIKHGLSTKESKLVSPKKYQAYYQDRLNKEQAAKLDEDGVIKPGMKVKPGDTLITALQEHQITTEEQKLKLLHKSLVRPYKDKAVTWDEDIEGEVVEVNKRGSRVDVHIKTSESMDVGDKIVGRHGNKGIVTLILPDHEMPKTKDGRSIEVIMNPIGTPGRMNIGQVLETAAAKIARKTGEPFKVTNFEIENNLEHVEAELKKHGLTDKETVVDPKTGKEIPGIQVGPQYILKMEHQVGKKMAARSRDSYDRNLVPKGGGPHGAQALGSLGIYSMLAHGSRANLREMQTFKSDKSQGGDNDELWSALQAGEMLPPPRTTFAYKKFDSYLKAIGVNTEKDGNSLNLIPLTDKHVLEMSNGELKDAGRVIKMRTLQPEKGGLFDPKITGGSDGTNWSHITLSASMPNPLFEKAVMSVANIRGPQFDKIINGSAGVLNGVIVEETGVKGATYGPSAIGHLLAKVDVKKDLAIEEGRIQGLKGQLQNESRRKVRYLRALDKLGMKPTEAYMMNHVPILPPNMRPIAMLDDGSLQTDDLNELYKQLAIVNNKHAEFPVGTPQSLKAPLQADIYDHLKALTGLGGTLNRKHPGILDVLSGRDGPKTSFVQDVLIKRKQDLTMRSTIVPEPSLSLDEAEIPRKAAKEMYKPFIVRELRRTTGATPLAAKKMIDEDDPLAHRALDRVVAERPILLKRDPVLHKYGIQAFKPKLVDGKAIKIHPLVCSGFNADFDGDAMSAYVPITAEAVKEAEQMFPSRNLFSPATGSVMYTPGHEAQVGLFMMADAGKHTNLHFKDNVGVEQAVKANTVHQNDVIHVNGVRTTYGRIQLNNLLPSELQGGKLLTDLNFRFTKKEQEKLFNDMAAKDRASYPAAINKMKDLGNEAATMGSFSFGLGDFKVHKDIRDPVLKLAETKAAKLDLSKKDQLNKFIDIYEGAMKDIDVKLKQRIEDPKYHNNLIKLEIAAGIKGKGLRQLTVAPVLFVDGKGEVVTSPVKKSYSEGLSSGDYWTATSGGRKGAIQKVQSVSEPGYLTKQMANSTMDMLVADHDCGTTRGISLSIDEPDVIGRYTVADLKLHRDTIPAGTLLTPEIMNRVKNAKIDKVVVRSPMRCVHGKGICAVCMGLSENGRLNDLGTNVGILATQSIGERGTQLAMKSFHCSHAHTIVTVKGLFNLEQPVMIPLDELFDIIDAPITSYKCVEQKECSNLLIYDGDWVELCCVKRHSPQKPIVIVSDSVGVTICQDNHPIAVRINKVRCERCGYHRLKSPGSSSSIKNGKLYCPKCGKYQHPLPKDEQIGQLIFLEPRELEPKRFYLERSIFPDVKWGSIEMDIPGYISGVYVAEGSTCHSGQTANTRGTPYSATISQKPGLIYDKILATVPTDLKVTVLPNGILIKGKEAAIRFENLFSRYSHNISLPPWFMSFNDEWLAEFMCGVIDGDGTIKRCKDGPDQITIDTTSFTLAQQIVIICTRLGVVSNLWVTPNRPLTRHQGYKVALRMTVHATHLFSSSIKVRGIEKISHDQEPKRTGIFKISSQREVLYTEDFVYDVETESGQFIASGVLSHNSGGVFEGREAATKSIAAGALDRAVNILNLPQKIRGSSILSTTMGRVNKIEKDPAGGVQININDKQHYVPADRLLLDKIRVGAQVKKGDPITDGPVNPHELLPLTNMSKVQGHLAGELHSIYGQYGIKRRHSELLVKALSNVTKVDNPGDHPDLLPGDFTSTTQVYEWNKQNPKAKPVMHTPVLRGVKTIPLDIQEDWMARLNHEHLKSTLVEAAQQGWQSNLHGMNPIPALMHGAEFGKGTKKEPWAY